PSPSRSTTTRTDEVGPSSSCDNRKDVTPSMTSTTPLIATASFLFIRAPYSFPYGAPHKNQIGCGRGRFADSWQSDGNIVGEFGAQWTMKRTRASESVGTPLQSA